MEVFIFDLTPQQNQIKPANEHTQAHMGGNPTNETTHQVAHTARPNLTSLRAVGCPKENENLKLPCIQQAAASVC